jgi:hypothetical protein
MVACQLARQSASNVQGAHVFIKSKGEYNVPQGGDDAEKSGAGGGTDSDSLNRTGPTTASTTASTTAMPTRMHMGKRKRRKN